MKIMKKVCCAIIILINLNSGFSQNINKETFSEKNELENLNRINQIDQILKLANEKVEFSGTVLVADSKGILYQNSIGYADTAKKVKLTTEHQISPGSVGKEFTTVAIMMLQEQGKLSYSDKLSKYLTNLPSWSSKITIEHILSHTSGLPEIKWSPNLTTDDVMVQLLAVEKLPFEPGNGYSYSNLDVMLRAFVIEKVTGESFASFFKKNILIPSGMLHTFNKIHIDNNPASFVYGDMPSAILGVTMYSTALDLYRFEKALWSGSLLNKESLKKGLSSHKLSGDHERTYFDFGGFTKDSTGITQVMHDGSNENQHTLKVSDFNKDLIVIIMSNDGLKLTPFELNDFLLNLSKYKSNQIPESWWFSNQIKENGFDATLVEYRKTMQHSQKLIKNEFSLWVYGYIMMLKGDLDNAIEIMKINTENFPDSADAYDSYAELLIKGNRNKEAKQVIKQGLILAKKSNDEQLIESLTKKSENTL